MARYDDLLFKVHLANFKVKQLEARRRVPSRVVLRGDFDGHPLVTNEFSLPVDPVWHCDFSFDYTVRPADLPHRHLRITCVLLSEYGGEIDVGSCMVNLHTLATGPASQDLPLCRGAGIEGYLTFDAFFEHETTAMLSITSIALDHLGPEGAYLYPYLSFSFITDEQPPVESGVADGRSPSWDVLHVMHVETTLAELLDNRLRFVVLHAEGGIRRHSDPVVATFTVPLRDLVSTHHDHTASFEALATSHPSTHPAFVTTARGVVELLRLPQYAQMPQGVHTGSDIIGGRPLLPSLPTPSLHSGPPPSLPLPLPSHTRGGYASPAVSPLRSRSYAPPHAPPPPPPPPHPLSPRRSPLRRYPSPAPRPFRPPNRPLSPRISPRVSPRVSPPRTHSPRREVGDRDRIRHRDALLRELDEIQREQMRLQERKDSITAQLRDYEEAATPSASIHEVHSRHPRAATARRLAEAAELSRRYQPASPRCSPPRPRSPRSSPPTAPELAALEALKAENEALKRALSKAEPLSPRASPPPASRAPDTVVELGCPDLPTVSLGTAGVDYEGIDVPELLKACANGDEDFVRRYAQQHQGAVLSCRRFGPLHAACVGVHPTPGMLRVLISSLRQEANQAEGLHGNTPLHYLAANRFVSVECLSLVLDAGAQTNIRNRAGFTPLHVACLNRHDRDHKFKRYLVYQGGAAVDQTTTQGKTSLHLCAVSDEMLDVVRFLLDAGANVSATCDMNTTALDTAEREGATAVARLLRERKNPP